MKNFLNWQRIKSWIQKGSLILPGIGKVLQYKNNPEGIPREIGMLYTGFNYADGSFDWRRLIQGYGPFVASVAITEGVSLLKRIMKRGF